LTKKGQLLESGKSQYKGKRFFFVKSITFLGLHLKSNLDCAEKINAIVRKCENPIKIMNCVKHTWWEADPIILTRLYKSLIRWRTEYGAFLFNKLKKKQLQKLEKIQYRAIRRALAYQSSTPTTVMLAEAKDIPIFCYVQTVGKELCVQVSYTKQLPNGPVVGRIINSSQ
jgi:hypothetical protein